jgi:hypothetical protein
MDKSDEEMAATFQSLGRDGFSYFNRFEGAGKSWLVFSPNQAKSATGNNGVFSLENNSTLYSRADEDSDASAEELAEARRQYAAVVARYTNPDGTKKPGWLKAPNGRNTKLNERQWVRVRTPFFKRYFGDWLRLAQRVFLDGTPVASISGEEFQKIPGASLIDRVVKFYEEMHGGKAVSPVYGDVLLNRRGVSDSLAHGIGRKKAAAFAAVPDVIRKGIVISAVSDYEGRGIDRITLGAPVEIGGIAHVAVVIIQRDPNGQRFYLHEVGLREELQQSPFKTGASAAFRQGEPPGGDAGALKTMLADIYAVNPDSVSKVVDENGEPLVVYHGTDREFTIFKNGKSHTMAPDGTIFLSTSPISASSYAKNKATNDTSLHGELTELPEGYYLEVSYFDQKSMRHVVVPFPRRLEKKHNVRLYKDGEFVSGNFLGKTESAVRKEAIAELNRTHFKKNNYVMECFVSLKNPLVEDFQGRGYSDRYGDAKDRPFAIDLQTTNNVAADAKKNGNDGAIIKNVIDSGDVSISREAATTIAVFNSLQIKSATGNNGVFSPDENASTLGSRAEEEVDAQFAADVEAVANRTYTKTMPLQLGETPPPLVLAGLDRLPLVMPAHVVIKATEGEPNRAGEHDLPLDIIKRLPALMRDPVAVAKSKSERNAFVVILEVFHHGKPVVAAIHAHRTNDTIEVNKIASVYEKDSRSVVAQWLEDALYYHRKKTRDIRQAIGVQFPKVGTRHGIGGKVFTDADLVNYFSEKKNSAPTTVLPERENAAQIRAALDAYASLPQGQKSQSGIRNRAHAQRLKAYLRSEADELDAADVPVPPRLASRADEYETELLKALEDENMGVRWNAAGTGAATTAWSLPNRWGAFISAHSKRSFPWRKIPIWQKLVWSLRHGTIRAIMADTSVSKTLLHS